MSLNDQILAALTLYGLPVLFSVTMISSFGIPLPGSFLLIAAGSFVYLGEMDLWAVIALSSAGAILGDQFGYMLGHWGGRRLGNWLNRRFGGEKRMLQVEALIRRWGAPSIFLSRWFVIQLGPWVNLTMGITGFPYLQFLLWDFAGEVFWVALFVLLGMLFSDRVQALHEMLGNLTWVLLGLSAAAVFAWLLYKKMHSPKE